jgi:hypothetical protein
MRRLLHRAGYPVTQTRTLRDTALLLGLCMAVVGSPILAHSSTSAPLDLTPAAPGSPCPMQPPQGLLDHLIESPRGEGVVKQTAGEKGARLQGDPGANPRLQVMGLYAVWYRARSWVPCG